MTDKSGLSYTVRDYQPADHTDLVLMYEDFEPKRAAQGLPPHGEERIRYWLERTLRKGRHLVVEVGGRVLGHVMLIPHEEGATELANFLHQSVRNRGIGSAVNAHAVHLARQQGFRRVWLSVEPGNKAAVRSYQKAGFRTLPGSLWAPELEMSVEL